MIMLKLKNLFKQDEHKVDFENLPQHIGIIMDGNGRWAKKRGLPRNFGHKKGAEVFVDISKYCRDLGIKYLKIGRASCRERV